MNNIRKTAVVTHYSNLGIDLVDLEEKFVISYENGYRDVRPHGYINPTCWETDSSSSSPETIKEPSPPKISSGLLPLMSEIRY